MILIFNPRKFVSPQNPRPIIFALYAMASASSVKIVTEYAKSGKSSCKKCAEKIESKSLRLGLNSRDPRGFDSTKWHHLHCFFSLNSNSVSSAETIEGFSELTGCDQEKLKQMVSEMDQSSNKLEKEEETKHEERNEMIEKSEGDIDTESRRRNSKKQKTNVDEESRQEKKNTKTEKIIVEYAKSGRSSCKKCAEKIDSKSLRLGLSIWDARGFDNSKWHHVPCFFSLNASSLSSVESIEGFSELKSSDQEMLKKLVSEGDQSSKKMDEDDENKLQGSDQKSGKLEKEEESKHEERNEMIEKRGDIDTESHRRNSKKQKTDVDEESKQEKKNTKTEKVIVEYAKSGRSSCKKCAEKIDPKSLRLGLSIWDPRGFENTKWHHAHCFSLNASSLSSVESIEGFSELKSSDQEMLKKLVSEGDESSKKMDEDDEDKLQGSDEKSGKTSKSHDAGSGVSIDFAVSDVKDNYKDAKLQPKWKAFQTIIYLERDDGLRDSSKIAAFDFDGCLAKTSVQRVGADAWSLMYSSIPKKLQSLYEDGYKLVIFTNEANIERWKNKRQVAVDSKIGRLNNFINLVKVPIQVFIACGVSKAKGQEEDPFRKPQPGMWRIMEQHFNSGIPIDMDQSFYVGDAAGRPDDHSDADKKFAETIGLKFYLPEEYFET